MLLFKGKNVDGMKHINLGTFRNTVILSKGDLTQVLVMCSCTADQSKAVWHAQVQHLIPVFVLLCRVHLARCQVVARILGSPCSAISAD